MARQANQSKNWDYTVQQVAMPHPLTGKPSGFFGNIRSDNQEILGITTEQYGLVQNSELIGVALEALNKAGMTGYEQSIIVTDGGSRVFAEFTFKNRLLAKAVGDKFGYKFVIKNSFDRSIRAALELGFLRLVCTNGMSTLEKEFSDNRKHSSRISVDFIAKAVENALKRGPEALKTFELLAERSIDDEKGLAILANFEDKGLLSGTLRESITTLWLAPRRAEDKARNLYNLYNAVTEHLTHKVAGDRYEYAQKTSASVLATLAKAATAKDFFAKIILPPVKEKVTMVAAGPVIDV
jgi:hypothetical protein